MSKIFCDLHEDGHSIAVSHVDETIAEEVMVINIDEIFDNVDIHRRVEDGEVQISLYAKVDPAEVALLVQSILDYVSKKSIQYGVE